MKTDDPVVLDVMKRSMIARIATLSRNGRPSINPLYFIYLNDHIWLGTVDWTLAARNVKADPRVSVLFEVEQDARDHRVLRISGRASVRMEQKVQRSYNLRTARKYPPSARRNPQCLTHIRLLLPMHNYHVQAAEKGQPCIIEVTPEQAEFLNSDQQV